MSTPLPRASDFRSEDLAAGLAKQDMALVALALRNGPTVIPLMKPAKKGRVGKPGDRGEVWTYRDAETGDVALLLFSDAKNKPSNLPASVGLHSPQWLIAFLRSHQDSITTVFLDIAGPHPMQASPKELLAALTVEI